MSSIPESSLMWTASELQARYGNLPLGRLFVKPTGAAATADDVVELDAAGQGLFELDRGLLIRKPDDPIATTFRDRLATILGPSVKAQGTGVLAGPKAALRAGDERILLPDLSYYSTHKEGGESAGVAFAATAPDLVVEIIRPGHTGEELELKLQEYFRAGVKLVWYAYPRIEEIHAYADLERVSIHTREHTLTAADVLPHLALPLAELFPPAGGS